MQSVGYLRMSILTELIAVYYQCYKDFAPNGAGSGSASYNPSGQTRQSKAGRKLCLRPAAFSPTATKDSP